MKIICDNGIYVQKKDIAFVINNTENGDHLKLININDENIYEFELFSSPKDIEFFSNLDFIVNYDDIKNIDEDDVIKLIQKANLEKIKMENTDSEKSNKNDILKQEYKIYSLRDALWFKQKYLKFELPDNIDKKNKNKKSKVIEYDDNEKTEIKSDKKVKRLSRLLTKREQKKIS